MKLVVFEDSEHYYEGGSDTYLLYVENEVDVMTLWGEYSSVPYKELKVEGEGYAYQQPFDVWCLEWGYSEEIPLKVAYEGN